MSVPLNKILPTAESTVAIRELTLDSRTVRPGDLFLAVPGMYQDGRTHIADAISRGAAAVAYEADNAPAVFDSEAKLVPVKGLAMQVSAIAGSFYGDPSRGLQVIGITGTNGKTSVSQLLAQALDLLGERCGVIGTLGNGFYGALEQSRHTTPDAVGVQAALAQLKNNGAKAVAMEVSSHGLDQGRVTAIEFDVAVFTNLSRDHLDYHGDMQRYGEAKARLFGWPGLRYRVINLDDDFGRKLAAMPAESKLVSYSLTDETADLHCTDVRFSDEGIQAHLKTSQGDGLLRSTLLGRFNLSNLLAVVGSLHALGYGLDQILDVMPRLQGPAGRMQRLGGESGPLVVVDYAHTPDALDKVLSAMRPHAQGRLMCLFGCGGDRDRGKRPLMAAVAERLADEVWVTDDNPRTENPAGILDDIRAGFVSADAVHFIPGRAQAIAEIIAAAAPGDVVVLAGKGHEDYQEINGQRMHFSDLEEAEKALSVWEVAHA